jgi:SAM-dependent methyltransferase
MSESADRTPTGAESDKPDHWSLLARRWDQVGPPLRPVAEDIGFCWDAVREWVRRRGAPRVLLLGVTPELYHLPWPRGTGLLAVDRSQAMIDNVWPGPKDAAQCADWLALTLADGSRDIVLCDGGLHLLRYPQEQQRLVRILHGVLSDAGLCILRLYVPPSRRESPEAILEDLLQGRISSLDALKMRLWTAMSNSAAEGVELAAVWNAVQEAVPDLEALAANVGWPAAQIMTISAYRDSTVRYHFATVDQVRGLFCGDPGGFEVHDLKVPSYELGKRCPTIVLRRCSRAGSRKSRRAQP